MLRGSGVCGITRDERPNGIVSHGKTQKESTSRDDDGITGENCLPWDGDSLSFGDEAELLGDFATVVLHDCD